MAAFFSTQLDFIFFFYGLAFILLGSVSLAIARGGRQETPWRLMAAFGFLHGTNEWFDLLSLAIGDSSVFTAWRLALMIASFAALVEFARLDAARAGYRVPERWIHGVLLTIVAAGAVVGGMTEMNALARYSFGFVGSAATAAALALHGKGASRSERWWIAAASLGFALYALAAGIVVPASDILPYNIVNQDSFAAVTGTPVQLVRGLLACGIAFAIWGVWGQRMIAEIDSARYTAFMQRQFVSMLATMAAILIFGWALTDYLGEVYRVRVEEAARGDIELIAGRMSHETSGVEKSVRLLAEARSIRGVLSGTAADAQRAVSALDRYVEISGASDGLVLDRKGQIFIAANNGDERVDDFSAAPYFLTALSGHAGFHYAVDPTTRERNYYASFPVRNEAGAIIGVAVLKKGLEGIGADLRHFERSVFVVDADGVVVMTNRPHMMYRTLWPLPQATRLALARQYDAFDPRPLFNKEVLDPAWLVVDGRRDHVERRQFTHGDWSLVTLNAPQQGLVASRVLGIIITLQMAVLAIVYLAGRQRSIRDGVQMEQRLELVALARELDTRATTDPLTGLYNRRKFNSEVAAEMLRAKRYGTPLSLIMFDIDHFKAINDRHGHQMGDTVLTELAHLVGLNIRTNDVLARWGGEEFVILAPGSDGIAALQLAEKLHDGIDRYAFEGIGRVTCSFGVAELAEGEGPESFVGRADAALYEAKSEGRDRVQFTPLPKALAVTAG